MVDVLGCIASVVNYESKGFGKKVSWPTWSPCLQLTARCFLRKRNRKKRMKYRACQGRIVYVVPFEYKVQPIMVRRELKVELNFVIRVIVMVDTRLLKPIIRWHIIIIIIITHWTLWSLPSAKLQQLAQTLLRSFRRVGASSCISGDGTDQRVQSLMMMIMMMMMCHRIIDLSDRVSNHYS